MRFKQNSFDDIPYHEYPRLFSHLRETAAPDLTSAGAGLSDQRAVLQFWDTEPDRDVERLLTETRRICEASGVAYKLYDDETAREFMANHFGRAHAQAYDKCVHPAQKSDLFRYWYLAEKGGLWLDADLVLAKSPLPLLALQKPVFFQRMAYHGQLTNWLLVAPPHDRLMLRIAERSLRNIQDDASFRSHVTKGDIVAVTGPTIVRQVVAQSIHEFCRTAGGADAPAFIVDESVHDQFVQDGAAFLGRQPKYKRTDRSWQKWRRRVRRRQRRSELLAKWKFWVRDRSG